MTCDFQQCSMCDQQRLIPACAYAQTDQSLCLSLKHSMTFKLLTEHHLEFLSLKGVCTGLSEHTLIKMPHRWKSHVAAQMCMKFCIFLVTSNICGDYNLVYHIIRHRCDVWMSHLLGPQPDQQQQCL